MADNIDKALNELDLKTDSLPSDWLITLVNPKEGIPAQNMTIARFTELFGDLLYKSKSLPPEGGVFIMFHRKSDNLPLMIDPSKWSSYQSGGEIADGVAVVEGGKILIVAPTEPESLLWSSAEVSAGGKTTSSRIEAINDWAGKTSTAAQITHTECSGTSYAPGYCAQYSRVNANGRGLTAGKWWLPSLGELMMILANKRKIDYALSLINGATMLAETWYWSSTESNKSSAWVLTISDGYLSDYLIKSSSRGRVRAVSAFIQ